MLSTPWNDKWDYMKLKNFWTAKETVKEEATYRIEDKVMTYVGR